MILARHIRFCLPAAALLIAAAQPAGSQQPQDAASPQTPAPIVRRPPQPAKPPILVDQFGNPIPPRQLTQPRPVKPDASTTPAQPTPPQKPAVDVNGNPLPAPAPKTRPKPAATSSAVSPNPATLIPAPPGPFNPTTILIDPAHGGGDVGDRFSDQLAEKDVTLSLAFKLRSLLAARGFTVVLTRDNDSPSSAPGTPLTLDDRAGLANHARPAACLLLHATASGSGVHLYTSDLPPTEGELPAPPWLTAQAPWVNQSAKLAQQLSSALTRAKIPLVSSQASVRPIDSLTCPATVIELAPSGSDVDTLNDGAYQQRVADALAAALLFWQNAAQPPQRLVAPPKPAPASTAAPDTKAEPKPGAQP